VLCAVTLIAMCGRAPAPASGQAGQSSGRGRHASEAHLQIDGATFRTSSGTFVWRGISAFRLVEMVAHGREPAAAAYLDWTRQRGLTTVRVLVMAHHLFRLAPGDGRAALPRLLELARQRDLHVEVVALADTADIPLDLDAHVKAIGAIVAKYPNALVEIANEPGHPTQDRRLHDPSFLQRLAALVPDEVPVVLGSAEYGDGYAGGDYATFHFPRESDGDGWGHVTALAEGAEFVARWRKPVVSDEPIGAGHRFHPGRRDNEPRRFRAAATLTRLAGLHATFHYEGGLQATVPEGRELACFDAWLNGLELVRELPAGGRFLAADALGRLASVTGARAAFAREFEREAWLLIVDPGPQLAVKWSDGWQEHTGAAADGARLLRARRR
jgi:hypothetical protein